MTLEQASHPDCADETNDLVPLLLGAMKLLDDFAAAAEQGLRTHRADPEPEDDPLLAAALGLLSLRRTIRRWALLAGHDHTSPPQPAANQTAHGAVSLR